MAEVVGSSPIVCSNLEFNINETRIRSRKANFFALRQGESAPDGEGGVQLSAPILIIEKLLIKKKFFVGKKNQISFYWIPLWASCLEIRSSNLSHVHLWIQRTQKDSGLVWTVVRLGRATHFFTVTSESRSEGCVRNSLQSQQETPSISLSFANIKYIY